MLEFGIQKYIKEIKYLLDGAWQQFKMAKERISELEDRLIELSYLKRGGEDQRK